MAVQGMDYRPPEDDITFGKITGDIGLDTIASEGEYLGTTSRSASTEEESYEYKPWKEDSQGTQDRKQRSAIGKLLTIKDLGKDKK
jgi:hypothetical protein